MWQMSSEDGSCAGDGVIIVVWGGRGVCNKYVVL